MHSSYRPHISVPVNGITWTVSATVWLGEGADPDEVGDGEAWTPYTSSAWEAFCRSYGDSEGIRADEAMARIEGRLVEAARRQRMQQEHARVLREAGVE